MRVSKKLGHLGEIKINLGEIKVHVSGIIGGHINWYDAFTERYGTSYQNQMFPQPEPEPEARPPDTKSSALSMSPLGSLLDHGNRV